MKNLSTTYVCALVLSFAVVGCAARPKRELIPAKKTNVLVTGASSGIGKSTVLEFAKNDQYRVYATMRNINDWGLPIQDNIVVTEMDVTSEESVNKAVDKMIAAEGYIDIVVNNAGYAVIGCLEAVTVQEAQAEFDVNVWGVVRVLQAVLPHMRNERKGHVINLSSTAGIRGSPALDFYSGSKFALEGIMDSMRYTLSRYNIHITNVNPGPVQTSFGGKLSDAQGTRQVPNDPEEYISEYSDIFLRSFDTRVKGENAQTSEEVARVVVNVAILGSDDKKRSFTDIPFNIGTGRASQAVIESVKKNPTGWGGLYTDMVLDIKPLPPKSAVRKPQQAEL